jgi:transcriptional regulator with XRE-family HTH domain
MTTLAEKLIAAREAKGWTQADLAEAIGMTQQGVAAIENGKSERPKKLRELARALSVTQEHLLGEEVIPEPERTKGQPVNVVPGETLILPGREQLLPVYSGAEGGPGKLIVSADVVDRIEMPAYLREVRGAYGILCHGSSMEPEFWPGDIAYVNPILRPMRGQPHVFYHTPPLGEDAEAIIKHLLGWNDREWDLQQWKPAKQFSESRKIWPICHRVVGKKNAS